MVWIEAGNSPDEWYENETYYQTNYGRWNGFVSRIPLLRQIIDIRSASVFSSWVIKGSHDKKATKMLNKMEGRNHETFKEIMANLYRIAYICGDAYAEKIYEENDPEKNIIDLKVLPSDNVRQCIKKGKIENYTEITTGRNIPTFRIFHIKYMARGALTHGLGMVEGLNNILVSYEQMLQIGQEIYERMSKPRELILAKTDNKAKLDLIRDAIKDAGDTWSGIAVLPETLISDIKDIQLSVSLKPQEWLDTLKTEIFNATATPEIVLGTGYANSEESLAAHMAGFQGSIRYDQEMFEEDIRKQIFEEMWPDDPPEIEFNFTAEPFDDKYNRILQSIPIIESSQATAPANKEAMIKDRWTELGFIT